MSEPQMASLSPKSFLNVDIPPSPSTFAKRVEEKKKHQMYLYSWDGMTLLPDFKKYLLQMRYTKLNIGNPIRPDDSPAVKYINPVINFSKELLLDADSPQLWSYGIEREGKLCASEEVMILGLGSPSSESSWIPLLDLPNRDRGHTHFRSEKVPDIDWDVERKCICVMVFLEPGTVDWQDTVYHPTNPLHTNDMTVNLFHRIRRLCTEHQSAFCLLTDGIFSGIIDNRERDLRYMKTNGEWYGWKYELYPVTEFPVRLILAFFVLNEVEMLGLFVFPDFGTYHLLQGCLDHEISGTSKSIGAIPLPKRFRDFDYFALQRDKGLWRRFCKWKTETSQTSEVLQAGVTLTVECGGFSRHHPTIRSPFPNQPVPQDTLDIVKRAKRDRDVEVDRLLTLKAKLSFNITRVIRAGPQMFSQVFFGTLDGHELCLKLFDEQFFPTPQRNKFHVRRDMDSYEDSDEGSDEDSDKESDEDPGDEPAFRLWPLNFADDMMRREEGVYFDHLEYLQGSLIPHCYGFHYFQLPDGHKVLGMLLEVIHGPSLGEVDLSEQPEPIQRNMVTRIRHAVRAMAYAGVMQDDWHSHQILCPPSDDVTRNPSSLVHHELVLIDFAFAKQRYGEDVGCPPENSHHRARFMLLDEGLSTELCNPLWFSMDEEEF